ncbi:MAG TPA: hypothetical protein PKA19_02300 [Bacillota bacterium]|nr:hypothetical protein [Bacillota bacterium]
MNQTDLRVIRSKKLIQEAFFELMEEKGYQNLTIKDISERARLAVRGTGRSPELLLDLSAKTRDRQLPSGGQHLSLC